MNSEPVNNPSAPSAITCGGPWNEILSTNATVSAKLLLAS